MLMSYSARWRIFAKLSVCLILSSGCFEEVLPSDPEERAATICQAWNELGFMNFSRAQPVFEQARETLEVHSDAWFEMTLGLAVCLHHGQPDMPSDKLRAAALYDEILTSDTDHRVKPFAMLYRARLEDQIDYYQDKPDLKVAEELYRRLLKSYPDHRLAHEAILYLTQIQMFNGDPAVVRRALEALRAWVEAHPGNPLESLHWGQVAAIHEYVFEELEPAVTFLMRAEAAGLPRMTRLDGFFWRVARLAERAGKTETALRYFRRILVELPRSAYGYEAQLRIRKLGGDPPPLPDPFAENEAVVPPSGGRQ
jgi:tetratricopeptide (TPR) repeat protein